MDGRDCIFRTGVTVLFSLICVGPMTMPGDAFFWDLKTLGAWLSGPTLGWGRWGVYFSDVYMVYMMRYDSPGSWSPRVSRPLRCILPLSA